MKTVKQKMKPFENAPVSELQKRLYGEPQKMYDHEIICSGDRRKPIGSPGCVCKIIPRVPFVIEWEIAGRVK
jgi:hypothetical protein